MKNERRGNDRGTTHDTQGTCAVIQATPRISLVRCEVVPEDEEFCEGCEFIKLANPEGLGWCKVHDTIDGRNNDPRDHEGENL